MNLHFYSYDALSDDEIHKIDVKSHFQRHFKTFAKLKNWQDKFMHFIFFPSVKFPSYGTVSANS